MTTQTKRLSRAEQVHAATPPSRNRVVDFLRAAAITVVVLGHWTIVAVDPRTGIEPHGVLDHAPWTHPLTWVFQVMPIFFLVGGYSNAISWRSARKKDQTYGAWLRTRLRRLGIPLLPLLIIWLIICWVAIGLGAPLSTMQLASQMALIPTWFLAAYLMVIVFAPLTLVTWERFGWWSVIIGLVLAAVVDLISIGLDNSLIGYANYVLVWVSVHQLGYAWLDGRLAGTARRLALAGIGALGLALLVGLGPYPVSMITSGADEISNSNPTRITMAFLGMVQAGLVLAFEPALNRALQRPRLWLLTVLVNQRIMSWFLWHLTAMVGLAQLLLALGGIGLVEPLTTVWWLTRPLWCLVLLAITAVFVLIFGRFESPKPDPRPAPPIWKPVAAAICCVGGVAVLASVGLVGAQGVNGYWPVLVLAGMVAFGVLRMPWDRPRTPRAEQTDQPAVP
ncbi:acyltransferase family protein [Naumannella halotolerans]|uniref:Fucose 4-O-acetylase-like acetyltransferase n=1 Tax=Naumannella halotolerans TaxID=993414 RepID=A0A4R7J2F6_9ACTN|nr:acyltransferase [Naumannella halotolerans]TDT31381.1 fucose 4-O-acetylase-like acetyltransferase [Naumannella halotolerans]